MMNWWKKGNFEQKLPYLKARSVAFKLMRSFFEGRDYTEVHTPALQICPVMDAHIHAFKTTLYDVSRTRTKDLYLHTSPEFDMKKLLAAGMTQIYQICPVYRNAEGSSRHSAEFMILEWYHVNQDYTYLMSETTTLIQYVANGLGTKVMTYNGLECDPFREAKKISVVEAFSEYAQIDLLACLDDRDALAFHAQAIGVRVVASDLWDDIFHAVMAEKIEPFLGNGSITILYDYPISMASLSRPKAGDHRFAERFELYMCGVEIANAFSELTDAKIQQERYEIEMKIKQELYGEVYPRDEAFFDALSDMPESAGIALGVERLIMLCTGAQEITQVQWCSVAPVHH